FLERLSSAGNDSRQLTIVVERIETITEVLAGLIPNVTFFVLNLNGLRTPASTHLDSLLSWVLGTFTSNETLARSFPHHGGSCSSKHYPAHSNICLRSPLPQVSDGVRVKHR